MNRESNEKFDVIFLGGGLASGLMSRHLKIRHPDLKILVLEKNLTTHWNPGESTVGVAGFFMIRDLGLSTYLYLNHLPKNGLRYFFNSSHTKFDPTRCSEIGSNILPIFPTFQVDRARLDRDLWQMNREIGIHVRTGAHVQNVAIHEQNQDHLVEYSMDGLDQCVNGRWLINSSGRNSRAAPIFNTLTKPFSDPDLNTAGAWGRFQNVKDIDTLGNRAWRGRVGHTSRYLSTNHFMGQGFWIWAIPIDQGVVSWGIVYDKDILGQDLTKEEDFQRFILAQPFVNELLADAELMDFQAHFSLPFKREVFCSKNRWAVVGDTHGFIDPFYSPGSDVLSRQAYYLDHLISARDEKELEETVDIINSFTRYEYELLRLLYVNQYDGFGSFEVFNIKSLWDFHSYTNRMVWNFLSGKYRDLQWMKREIKASSTTKKLTEAIQNGFRDLSEYLREHGLYEHRNLDEYSLRQNRFRIEEDMLREYSDDKAIENHLYLCRLTITELLETRFSIHGLLNRQLIQDNLGFSVMSRFQLNEVFLEEVFDSVARQIEREVENRFHTQIRVNINLETLRQELPEDLQSVGEEIQEFVKELWNEKDKNPVRETLFYPNPDDLGSEVVFGREKKELKQETPNLDEELMLIG